MAASPAWNGQYNWEYPGQIVSSINFRMIEMDPTNESYIYSMLHFVADQAKEILSDI